MQKAWVPTLFLLAGSALIGMALFADRLRLDPNSGWGRGRIAILAIGAATALGALLYQRQIADYFSASEVRKLHLFAGITDLLVILIYIWYAGVGRWTGWPQTTDFYDRLASAFQHGQLSLEAEPDPALLALQDPYDYVSRKDIATPWDLSLYQGKFYLYWGPAPALILTGVKFVAPNPIGDHLLVFGFLSGLLVFNTLLLLALRKRFFPDLPEWTILIGLLLAGLVCPIPWMLNLPRIYEAAIAAGQFFFVGGLYFAFTALERRPASWWRLVFAGLFWASAVASRALLVFPVIFMVLMIISWILQSRGAILDLRPMIPALAALGLPLGLGILGLGWYNWARFDSLFEFGYRYTLNYIDFNRLQDPTFSAGYLPANLYMYLFTPFGLDRIFPFLLPQIGQYPAILQMIPSGIRHSEEVTGLLFTTPFVCLAILPTLNLFRRRSRTAEIGAQDAEADRMYSWTSISLLGSAMLALAGILVYFYATMRFMEDFVPTLILLAILGFWQGSRQLAGKPLRRSLYHLAAGGLAITSILAGLLLAIAGHAERFWRFNPQLIRAMIEFFGR